MKFNQPEVIDELNYVKRELETDLDKYELEDNKWD
jgi:hypothetical protein